MSSCLKGKRKVTASICVDQLVVVFKREKKRLHCIQLPGSSKECNSGKQRRFKLVVSVNQRKRKVIVKGSTLEV